jgi:hypothetical protein
MLRLAAGALTCIVCLTDLRADELDGRYLATIDGLPTEMTLRSEGDKVQGEYVENARLRLIVNGRFDGQLLRAQISDPDSGRLIANMNANYANAMLNAHIAARSPRNDQVFEREALFQRQAGDANVQPIEHERDPELVGTWVHQRRLDAGDTSIAAISAVTTLQLSADGRVTQWRGALAGNNDWNRDIPGELQYSGHWQSANGLLLVHVQGQPHYRPAAHYRFDEQQLVTASNAGEIVWQRR